MLKKLSRFICLLLLSLTLTSCWTTVVPFLMIGSVAPNLDKKPTEAEDDGAAAQSARQSCLPDTNPQYNQCYKEYLRLERKSRNLDPDTGKRIK